MQIEKDFEELLNLFNKYKVKYCVIGAFAVGFYAKPRYTKDMDILIEPTEENGIKITKALTDFGFGSLRIKPNDFTKKGHFIQLGYEPVRVDLITSIPGCSFYEVWKNKKSGPYGKERVYFIGINELIKNKKSINRMQDKVDIKLLESKLRKKP